MLEAILSHDILVELTWPAQIWLAGWKVGAAWVPPVRVRRAILVYARRGVEEDEGRVHPLLIERHALRVVPVGKDPVRELLGEVELRLHVVAVFMIPEHTVPRHLQRLGTVWPEKIGLAAKGGLDWE